MAIPLYEFLCQRCAHAFDVLRPIAKRDDTATCPRCLATDTDRNRLSPFSLPRSTSAPPTQEPPQAIPPAERVAGQTGPTAIKMTKVSNFQMKNVTVTGFGTAVDLIDSTASLDRVLLTKNRRGVAAKRSRVDISDSEIG